MTSLWLFVLFFNDEFFIFRLESVICKKYTSTNNKDSKYTNTIDISIIWSCGGGVGDAGSFIAYIVSSAGSFIACIASISATLHRLGYFLFNLFMDFSLPLRAFLTHFESFVTFSGVLSMFILKYKEKELKQTWIQFLNILFLIQPGKK